MKRIALIILVAALQFAASAYADSRASLDQAFDRNKGALYSIYNREVRTNPYLKGKIVFEIDIEVDGAAINCRVKSSELHAPDFEARLCERIRQIQFPQIRQPTTIKKSLQFFPPA